LLEEMSSPEKDDDMERGKEVPIGGSKGADGKDDFMGGPSDSIALQTGEDDKAHGTAGVDGHLIEAKDRFSELGTFSISRRLAFRGTDIDPYPRYPLQVDVASVMKELGDLMGLEPSEAETAGVASTNHPALPRDVKNFDAEGTTLWPCFLLDLVFCAVFSCVLVCVGFMKSLGVYGAGNLG